jgi:hypothetical protein
MILIMQEVKHEFQIEDASGCRIRQLLPEDDDV